MTSCEHAGSNLQDLRARTQGIVDNEVVQTDNQREFECLTRKSTDQFEQGTMQSSSGGTAMAAGRPAPEDSQMTLAAVAESATTQSTTSSMIRVVETEDQFNTECHKVLAGISDRHVTIADMDTSGAIVLTTDPEDCDDGLSRLWTGTRSGAKSGHLGLLFGSQKVSERRIKELANIEKLEVAEITLQETIARTTEIVYARWLDDVARGTPEDPAADRRSEDATQVNAPDHEEGVQATTPIKTFRIILSMVATKGTKKEQHHSTSNGWRSMTTWNEHETDKCWEEVKSILMGKLVIGVPTTFVSENHGCVVVHRGINFPSSGSDAESNGTGCVRMAHSDTKIIATNQTDVYGGEITVKRNSCRGMRWSLQGSEWKSNSKHVEHVARLWRLKLESKETPTPVTKAETSMKH